MYKRQPCRTYQIDHDLDHVDPSLPLCDVVEDLYSTDPTQENISLDHASYTAPARKHELDYTDQEQMYLPYLADLDHEL